MLAVFRAVAQFFSLGGNEHQITKQFMNNKYIGFGIALGLSLGVVLGAAIHNVAIGIGVGLSFGVAIGAAIGRRKSTD